MIPRLLLTCTARTSPMTAALAAIALGAALTSCNAAVGQGSPDAGQQVDAGAEKPDSSDGKTGSGGTLGTGGVPGTGGVIGSGGKTGSGGVIGSGGKTGSGGSGSGGSTGKVFSQCRFHFGTIDSVATKAGTSMISQLDFFTPGWMLGNTFDQSYVCDEGKTGAVLGNQVPVVVAYLAAGITKRKHGLCDCNVTTCGAGNDLCKYGAQYIAQDWATILDAYRSYSAGYASCYGTTRPIVFEMEPDWYQYTISGQTQPWTAAQAGSRMAELVAALKTSLPNARFSMDASPWVGSNGTDNGLAWYSNFNMSLFTFVNTSGGGTNANTAKIRSSNNMTWAGLHSVTGKPILADTGYGANGVSAGEDPNWNVAANINARIADGVVSIAQYNPTSGWGSTIAGIRGQLNAPGACP